MDVVGHFIDYLLNHGQGAAAIVLAVVVLAAGGLWRLRRAAEAPAVPTASSRSGGQTTQVSHVRTKGDVTVSPTQHHG